MKNYSYFLGVSEFHTLIRNRKDIRRQSDTLSREALRFSDGQTLGEIAFASTDGDTSRKIRRIIEKRVCQEFWKSRDRDSDDNFARFNTKHFVSNHMKNLYRSYAS